MKTKKISALLKHDFNIGFTVNIPKYIISVLVCSFLCVKFYNSIVVSACTSKGTIMDCYMYLFKGIKVYIPSQDDPFKIPFEWLTIQALIGLLIIQYPTQDLYSYGMQILIRTKKRISWWLSKCIWNVVTILIFYILCFIISFAFSAIFGELSILPNENVNAFVSGINLTNIKFNLDFYATVIVLPILTTVAISLLQMTLSFFLNPIISYLGVTCIMASSTYYHSIFLVGNYNMILRNQPIYSEGFGQLIIIIIDLLIIFVSIFVGLVRFKQIDILKKD